MKKKALNKTSAWSRIGACSSTNCPQHP